MRIASEALVSAPSLLPATGDLASIPTFNPPVLSQADESRRLMEDLMLEKPRVPKNQTTTPRPSNASSGKDAADASSMARLVDAFSNQPSTVVLSAKEHE